MKNRVFPYKMGYYFIHTLYCIYRFNILTIDEIATVSFKFHYSYFRSSACQKKQYKRRLTEEGLVVDCASTANGLNRLKSNILYTGNTTWSFLWVESQDESVHFSDIKVTFLDNQKDVTTSQPQNTRVLTPMLLDVHFVYFLYFSINPGN